MLKNNKGEVIKTNTVLTYGDFVDILHKYAETHDTSVRLENCIKCWLFDNDEKYTALQIAELQKKTFLSIRNVGSKSWNLFVKFQEWMMKELDEARTYDGLCTSSIDHTKFGMNNTCRSIVGALLKVMLKKYIEGKSIGGNEDAYAMVEIYFHDVEIMEKIIEDMKGCEK